MAITQKRQKTAFLIAILIACWPTSGVIACDKPITLVWINNLVPLFPQVVPDARTDNQTKWMEGEARKKFPGICYTSADQANWLIVWTTAWSSYQYSYLAPQVSSTTIYGSIYGSQGYSGNFSGRATTTTYQWQSGTSSVSYAYAWLYQVKKSGGSVVGLEGPLFFRTHTGRWRWSKPDKDAVVEVYKHLAQRNPAPSSR